ncbi:hypothetical protein C9422_06010 [Pseudomonas sp. B1(2018)]|nr:hypothetical protein C9422_06010 [Pseudomonas sp. B1(2018)]
MVGLFFALCRSELAPGGVPTMDFNAPRFSRMNASSLTSIASKLAPTGGITGYEWSVKPWICALCGACWD